MPYENIMIVDDSASSRLCLRLLFEEQGHKIIGEYDSIRAFNSSKTHEQPSLISLDYSLSDGTGVSLYKKIKKTLPHVPIFFVTSTLTPSQLMEMYETGTPAILHKENLEAMPKVINYIQRGQRYFDEDTSSRLLELHSMCQHLTLVERRTFLALLSCNTITKVAENLSMADRTIRCHKQKIIVKLGKNIFNQYSKVQHR